MRLRTLPPTVIEQVTGSPVPANVWIVTIPPDRGALDPARVLDQIVDLGQRHRLGQPEPLVSGRCRDGLGVRRVGRTDALGVTLESLEAPGHRVEFAGRTARAALQCLGDLPLLPGQSRGGGDVIQQARRRDTRAGHGVDGRLEPGDDRLGLGVEVVGQQVAAVCPAYRQRLRRHQRAGGAQRLDEQGHHDPRVDVGEPDRQKSDLRRDRDRPADPAEGSGEHQDSGQYRAHGSDADRPDDVSGDPAPPHPWRRRRTGPHPRLVVE
jgi:hypothetical protein